MSSAKFPLVDAREVLKKVGGGSFTRGKMLVDAGQLSDLAWDSDALKLSGTVLDDGVEVAASVTLVSDQSGFLIGEMSCGTDAEPGCKHVAALLIDSNARHMQAKDEREAEEALQPVDAEWELALSRILESGRAGRDGQKPEDIQPLGLQFELRDSRDASQRQYGVGQGPKAVGARGARSRFTLAIRPVIRNPQGRWIRSALRWNTISFKTYGLPLDPEQHRWFCQLVPLYRANGELYFGEDNDWLIFDDFASGLVFSLLEEAHELGIELVGSGDISGIELVDSGRVYFDAQRTDAGLELIPTMDICARTIGARTIALGEDVAAGTVGRHGVWALAEDGHTIEIAPVDHTLEPEARFLVRRPSAITVPAGEVDHFFSGPYQRLGRRVSFVSSDGSVALPQITPPSLVVVATYQPDDVVVVDSEVDYGPGGIDDYARDMAAEAQLRTEALKVLTKHGWDELEPHRSNGGLMSHTLEGLATVDFVRRGIPALEQIPHVRVLDVGKRPVYKELTEAPELTVTTVESDKNDWFDLGLMITVGDRRIPYADILRALSAGQKRMLMSDKTYVSLDQPLFHHLRSLIEEANMLKENPKDPLRITRYQVNLWDELAGLATEASGPDSWHAAIAGLADGAGADAMVPDGVEATLRPYQVEGFRWLASLWRQGLGGILADDMGLGKTLQVITLLAYMREQWADAEADAAESATTSEATSSSKATVATGGAGPVLVVAPTSVVPNWLAELRRFAPDLKVAGVRDTQAKASQPLAEVAASNDVVVTSYTLFRLDSDVYQEMGWSALILDEAQFVKNKSTKAHQTARDLNARVKFAITGTPLENNLMELWALLAITSPGLFPSSNKFAEVFGRPIERMGAVEPLERLRRRVRPFMLRRTKAEVMTDLPSKQEQVLAIDLSEEHRRIYDTRLQRERQKVLHLVEDINRNRFTIFTSLTTLRLMALDPALVDEEEFADVGSAKLDVLLDYLNSLLAEGHRALVFSQFTSFLKRAGARLDEAGIDYAYLDGATRNREEAIQEFKDGDAPVFLISLKAGGFGLNLTEADYIFLMDPWWNPAAEAQAVDRAHRIGQTRNVMVYRMVSAGTIEEKVVALQDAKRELITSVMDGGDGFGSALSADDIRELLAE